MENNPAFNCGTRMALMVKKFVLLREKKCATYLTKQV
jgi:hypothetical protein